MTYVDECGNIAIHQGNFGSVKLIPYGADDEPVQLSADDKIIFTVKKDSKTFIRKTLTKADQLETGEVIITFNPSDTKDMYPYNFYEYDCLYVKENMEPETIVCPHFFKVKKVISTVDGGEPGE